MSRENKKKDPYAMTKLVGITNAVGIPGDMAFDYIVEGIDQFKHRNKGLHGNNPFKVFTSKPVLDHFKRFNKRQSGAAFPLSVGVAGAMTLPVFLTEYHANHPRKKTAYEVVDEAFQKFAAEEILYHASPVQDIKKFRKSEDTSGNNKGKVIFGAKDPSFAAAFGVRWNDGNARLDVKTTNKDVPTEDNYAGTTLKVTDEIDINKPASMYRIKGDFENLRYPKDLEKVTDKDVEVISEEKFKTFKDMAKAYNLDLREVGEKHIMSKLKSKKSSNFEKEAFEVKEPAGRNVPNKNYGDLLAKLRRRKDPEGLIKQASDENDFDKEGKIPAIEKAFDKPIEKKVAYMIATSHEYKKPNVSAALSFVKNYSWELTTCRLKDMQGIHKPVDEAKVADMAKNMKIVKPFIVVNQFHGIRPQTPGKKILVDGHHRKYACEAQGKEIVPVYKGTYTGDAEKHENELREKGVGIKQLEYKGKTFAVDFDGTICENKFPEIGEIKEKTVKLMRKIKSNGGTIAIWTCRSGQSLADGLKWLKDKNIPYDYVNENPKGEFGSRKIYADYYIDDRAISVDDIEMGKVATYKEHIEKIAQTKWKTYLEEAKGLDEVKKRTGELLRNTTGFDLPYRDKVNARDAFEKGTVNSDLKKYIHKALLPSDKAKSLKSSTHQEINERKLDVRYNKDQKRIFENRYDKKKPSNTYDGEDGEKYINIIHGGTESRIKAFVRSGDSAYPTVKHVFTGDSKNPYSSMGIMAHSNYQGRAKHYADTAGMSLMDHPAVLTGKIQRKYLHNVGGDEYIIPQNHWDKIKDSKAHTQRDNPGEWESGDFYHKQASAHNHIFEKVAKQSFDIEEVRSAAKDLGVDFNEKSYSENDLKKGMDVELEHGKVHSQTNLTNDDKTPTAQIAVAHLNEHPKYYKGLEEMESKLEKEEGADMDKKAMYKEAILKEAGIFSGFSERAKDAFKDTDWFINRQNAKRMRDRINSGARSNFNAGSEEAQKKVVANPLVDKHGLNNITTKAEFNKARNKKMMETHPDKHQAELGNDPEKMKAQNQTFTSTMNDFDRLKNSTWYEKLAFYRNKLSMEQ